MEIKFISQEPYKTLCQRKACVARNLVRQSAHTPYVCLRPVLWTAEACKKITEKVLFTECDGMIVAKICLINYIFNYFLFTYVHTCICNTYICPFIYIYVYVHIYIIYLYKYIYIHIHIYIFLYKYTFICIYLHIYKHIIVCIYMYIFLYLLSMLHHPEVTLHTII